MKMKDAELVRHEELRKYIKAYDAFIPDDILSEIQPELDFDLLLHVEAAIKHLKAHVRIDPDSAGNYAVENISDPTYSVQKAAVDHALLCAFAGSRQPMPKFRAFLSATKHAKVKLARERREYDNEHGDFASNRLHLFVIDNPASFRNQTQENKMYMNPTALTYHRRASRYIKAYDAIIPSAILSEIRPELDFDLLLYVKAAVRHLASTVRTVYGVGEFPTIKDITAPPYYSVQQAGVNLALFREFAKTQYPLLNPKIFQDAMLDASETLASKKIEYMNMCGSSALYRLCLFGGDDEHGYGACNGMYLIEDDA